MAAGLNGNIEPGVPETEPEEGADTQAAELARLQAEIPPAMAETAQGETQPGAEVAEAQPSAEESLAGFLGLASMAAGFAGYEKTAAVWNEGACRGFSDRAVPVLQKYAWGQKVLNFLQQGAGVEEMALVMFLAPVGMATMQAMKADAAEIKSKAEAKKAARNQAVTGGGNLDKTESPPVTLELGGAANEPQY